MTEIVNRGYKVRIQPTNDQKISIHKTLGCCRLVWNVSLEERKKFYETSRDIIRGNESRTFKSQKDWKEVYPFLKEADSQALNTTQQNLNKAYKHYFKGIHGVPHFKSKKHSKESYTTHMVNNNIRIDGDYIKIPKIGLVKMRKNRKVLPCNSIIKAVTVSKTLTGKYFVSLRLEVEQKRSSRDENFKRVIGLDFSTTHFYINNMGEKANFPSYIEQTVTKIKKCQRKMSKQVKTSKGREKTRIKLVKLYEKKRNQLKDFHHKLSNNIIKNNDIIGLESLSLKEMNSEKYFQKRIQIMGWRNFIGILTYKAHDKAVILHFSNQYYASSKTCSVCGHKKETFPLSQKTYTCECGNVLHRDVNAAMNLSQEAMISYLTN